MTQIRVANNYYSYKKPINTFKSVCFNQLKNQFSVILFTQTKNKDNSLRCSHHIVIKNEERVKIQYIIGIVQSVYNGFDVENTKFSNTKDVIKQITRADTFPL